MSKMKYDTMEEMGWVDEFSQLNAAMQRFAGANIPIRTTCSGVSSTRACIDLTDKNVMSKTERFYANRCEVIFTHVCDDVNIAAGH